MRTVADLNDVLPMAALPGPGAKRKKQVQIELAKVGLKMCWCCDTKKTISDFKPTRQSWDGFNSKCRPCENAYKRAWEENNPSKVTLYKAVTNEKRSVERRRNPDKTKSADKAHYRKYKHQQLAYARTYQKRPEVRARQNEARRVAYQKNLEASRQKNREKIAKVVLTMSDGYVAELMGMRIRDVPKELIDLKREHLRLVRELKERAK